MKCRTKGSVCWRALVDSPLLLAVWTAIALLSCVLVEVAGSLQRAESARSAAATALARVAAETVAARHLPNDGGTLAAQIGDVAVAAERRAGEWVLTTDVGGCRRSFRGPELAGASPEAFAHPVSFVDPAIVPRFDVGRRITTDALPRIDERQLVGAVRADRCVSLRRDRGVALLTWEKGTERDDFVFVPERLGAEFGTAGALVVVPGHLWIEPGAPPLRFTLHEDLVLVVRGNLYVGRSIVVDGPGRLVLATARDPDGAVFADLDGNGRWSPGDALRDGAEFTGAPEGSGNVYFGLAAGTAALRFDASLVAGGEVHLRANAHVAGPLILAYGVTSLERGRYRLVPDAHWAFQVQRERVSGFVTSGPPRVGFLESLGGECAAGAQQALYLSSPSR